MTQAILPTITMALCASLQSSCAEPCASFSVEQEIDLSTGSGQGLPCTLSVDASGFEVVVDDGGSIRYQHPVGGSLAADGPCLLTFALDSETDFAVFQNGRAVFIAEHTFTAGELELPLAVTDDACVGSGGEGAALVYLCNRTHGSALDRAHRSAFLLQLWADWVKPAHDFVKHCDAGFAEPHC